MAVIESFLSLSRLYHHLYLITLLSLCQALKCDTNKCPTGITTQDKELTKGLDVPSKAVRHN